MSAVSEDHERDEKAQTEEEETIDLEQDKHLVKEEYLIYHSLNPHISIQLFFEQLISHLLFPLSLPFFMRKYGRTFPIAHGFYPTEFASILANWLFPAFFLLVLATSRYLPSQIGGGYAVPACIFLIHRFMVATKYATLSESEYAKYLDLDRPGGRYAPPQSDYLTKLACYQSQLQVIRGWLHLSPQTISYELHAAAKRLDVDLEHLLFYVPIPQNFSSNVATMSKEEFSITYQFDLWKSFLNQDDLLTRFPHITIPSPLKSTEYLCIDSCTLSEAIINLCNWSFSTGILLTPMIIALVFACIPIIFIFLYPSRYSHAAVSESHYSIYIVYHITSFLINSLLFNALIMILLVCIIDAYRKYYFFLLLSSLVRPNDIDTDTVHISARRYTKSLSSSNALPSSKSLVSITPLHSSQREQHKNRKSSILLPHNGLSLPHSNQAKNVTPIVEYGRISSIEEEEEELVHDSNGLEEIQKPETIRLKKQKSTFASRRAQYTFKAYAANDTRCVIPKLDFEIHNNIFSWSSVRLVFHNFGERMKIRIDCYIVVITCFMFILMIDLILNLYSTTATRNNSTNILLDPIVWQKLFCVFFCFTLMSLNLTYLFLVNTEMKKQRGTLSLLILAKYRYINQLETYFLVKSKPTSSSYANSLPLSLPYDIPLSIIPTIISDQRELISSLDDILTVYENIDEVKGSKLAGFKIERQHIVWIITTLSLFIYSLYQYFVNHH